MLNQKVLTSLVDFNSGKDLIARSRFKVSVLQMDIFCDSVKTSRVPRPSSGDTAYTSYQNAQHFLKWLTTEHRKANLLNSNEIYRLPHSNEINSNKVWTTGDQSTDLKSFGFVKSR